MNTRNGLIAAGVIAVLAIIIVLIQSNNLSQAEGKMSAIQKTATAQQVALADQETAAVATLSAASTQAADTQQKALSEAVSTAATAQANALNDVATSQANALNDAVNAASTMQARTLTAANQAAATTQATAITAAANNAATSQAQAVGEQRNAAATQLAQNAATLQAGATATLAAVVNAAASAQAEAVIDAQNAGATAQAQLMGTAEGRATATLGAFIVQAATERAETQMQYHVTDVAVQTQIAEINAELATAQANLISPTAIPTEQATAISSSNPTAEATQQIGSAPADWKRFVGKGVAIQLPSTYVGNELGSDPQALAKLMRSLGPDFAAAAALFESNPDILALIAVNPGNGDANPAANVVVVSIPLPVPISIETLMTATIGQLPKTSTVQEKSVVQLNGREVGRIIVETKVGGIDSRQLQYYIIEHNTFYVIAFTGVPGHFDAQLPIFEQSMQTFEILPTPGK
jgi:hypothetical protein